MRHANYSETSQVVTLLTRESGKIAAIAKGSKRPRSPFDGPIEVFSFGDIGVIPSRSGGLATLTEFGQKPVFRKLHTRLYPLNCSLFAAELTDTFTKDLDPCPELFDGLIQFLTDVQDAEDDFSAMGLLVLFQLSLLSHLGTKLVLETCANCNADIRQNRRGVYFSSSANGLICFDCESSFTDKIRLSDACGAALADLKLLPQTNEQTMKEIEKVLIYHFTELMHRPPKMAKYFL